MSVKQKRKKRETVFNNPIVIIVVFVVLPIVAILVTELTTDKIIYRTLQQVIADYEK